MMHTIAHQLKFEKHMKKKIELQINSLKVKNNWF